MRFARVMLGAVVMAGASAAATTSGCVSSTPVTPPDLGDSALPTEDTGAPPGTDGAAPDTSTSPHDAGADSTVTPPTDSGLETDAPASTADAGDASPSTDAADAAISTAKVRFGNFDSAPGVPALDICVSPQGAFAWQGPLLAGAGLAAGLGKLQVSSYFTVPAGLVDVRVLLAGSSSCDVDSGVGDYSVHTPIPAGSSITIAIADTPTGGDAGPGPAIVPLLDEPPSGTAAKLRLVNLAALLPSPVTLDLGSGVAAQPEFVNVTAAQVIDPTADSLGYKQVSPTTIDMTVLAAGPIGLPGVTLAAGGLVTTFIAETDTDGPQYNVVQCLDGQTSVSSAALSLCVSKSNATFASNYTRFANFVQDGPVQGTAVCIKYHDLSTFQGPLVGGPPPDAGQGAGQTLSPPFGQGSGQQSTLSGYFQVAGGFTYDVRFITGGSSDCTVAATPDYVSYLAPASGTATVAATGFITTPADAGEPGMFDAGPEDSGSDAAPSPGLPTVAFTWVTLPDDTTTANAARVVHFGAQNPQPFDVAAASWSFTNIPYGTIGTQASGVVDAHGYLAVPSGGGGFTVTDTIGGATEAPLSFGLSQTNSFFVFTYSTGKGSPTVGVLQCTDTDYTLGGIWNCTTLGGG